MILYTINMSHYSEKIRWILDYEGVEYRERALTPAIHTLPMLIKGKRAETTVPLIQEGNVCVQDSPRIVEWLAKNKGPLKSFPEAEQEVIREIQSRFDAIGKPVARFLYLPGFAYDDVVKTIWTQFAKPWEETLLRATYPVIKFVFKLKLKINKKDVARAEKKIDAAIKWLEQEITDKRYLVGDQLSIADITAASLLAPLACPPEHPIYGSEDFRTKMAAPAKAWADSPAMQWVRDIYRDHRGTIWARAPLAA